MDYTKGKYSTSTMFSIKDPLGRNLYLWNKFYDDDPSIIKERVYEYISQYEFKDMDDIELYIGTLVCIVGILYKTRENYDFYNDLYYHCILGYRKIKVSIQNANNAMKEYQRDDYNIWLRRNKINKIKEKLNKWTN